MKPILFAVAFTIFSLYPQTGQAQAFGRVAKWVGRTIATELISSVVDNRVEAYFDAGNSARNQYRNTAFTLSVTNNFPYHTTYFWVCTDGQNWEPKMLYPGQYFSVRSGPAGIVAIFNGSYVTYLNQGGQYYASGFFQ